jgi:hypothetical protein
MRKYVENIALREGTENNNRVKGRGIKWREEEVGASYCRVGFSATQRIIQHSEEKKRIRTDCEGSSQKNDR